ncbi:uncharacterized protein PHACADRAFT_107402 [Phanerochaete carnosa HHB-10118-sp]|uniref:Integrase zinc-binding domain-containing protein n=1 Tax=Phanerochaete carnosa (strain HHB-10118-sp) TaxID=650164 RepID=K5VDD7_PHACS|nr:uncharacterized protein PHACADRAFT_107402 [Phanerochaete carnosa HHB-10118-sp]EKM49148.1 hypothetical protein PHACADRAFT_107402 [Phanerochaete carnosa HHB-10118-sp]
MSNFKAKIPLTISAPVTIFSRICIDVMYMPGMQKTQSPRYLVIARDDLSGASEGRALEEATSEELALFFWEEIFLERGHQNIRTAIIKACGQKKGALKNWADHVPFALFADRITARRSLGGLSPYRLLFGVEPLLPFDLVEASFMIDSYKSGMTTAELLAARIQQLEKRPEDIAQAASTLEKHRLQSKEQFEKRFAVRLCKENYSPGTLVLVRNTAIEKSLNRKMSPKYDGPYQVIRQRQGGSYLLAELDGTPRKQAIAAFRIVPYISRSNVRLKQLEA